MDKQKYMLLEWEEKICKLTNCCSYFLCVYTFNFIVILISSSISISISISSVIGI